jgi:hypothetical protein
MAVSLVTTSAIEEPEEITPRALWQMELEAADKECEKFHKRGDTANDRFVDERDSINADLHWFNIYYANTNILESALYSQIPKPSVSRRYEDYRDNVARVGALILERSLSQDLNDPEDQFDSVMRQCVQDRLIPGLGTAWLRLETETEDIPTTDGGSLTNDAQGTQPHVHEPNADDGFTVPPASEQPTFENPAPPGQVIPLRRIKDQRVSVDYVYWKDFRWSPCRTYGERRWVARRVYLTKTQLTKRFGAAKAKLTSLDHSVIKNESSSSTSSLSANVNSKEVFKKATVWEIWDRTTRKVHWYAPGYPTDLLDTRDDFLKLQSFEPCPTPMFANVTTSSTVPRPDYYMIQDQYAELNTVNARISLLVQACKVVGVYDQGAGTALNSMLSGNENTMIPVPNWGQFSEKGGMKGSVDWLPLDQVILALQRLYEARDGIKGQIYELTGIADIVRGASKASETLGAQQIKAQFASIRIKKLQNEVSRFASEILRIKAEISVKHYSPDTLIRRSGIVYTDNDIFVPDAIALLKSEAGFKWRVTVQADSMAQADYDSEKKDRIEFMSAVTGYMAQAFPIAGQIPELKPVIFGLLKWGIAGFKGASDIEGMIDKQLAQLEGKPPPPPPPDPKIQALQMKAETDQQKAQQDAQAKQQDMQIKQQLGQMDMQKQQQELEFRRQEMEMERQMQEQEMEFKRQELQLKAEEHQQSLQATIQKSNLDLQTHQQVAQQKVQDSMIQSDLAQRQGEQQLDFSQQEHEQGMEQGDEAAAAKVQQMKAQAAAKPKPAPKGKE